MVTTPPNRYDLTLGSDKSSSLSRSEGGVYDVGQAESRAKHQQQENHNNIVNNNLYPMNGNSTLESQDGDAAKKRVSKNDTICKFTYLRLKYVLLFSFRNGQRTNPIS